jgi:arylsulfatase A-like enzyme
MKPSLLPRCAALGALAICTFSVPARSSESATPPAAMPPNILVVITDDMGFSDIGSYGGEIETPNLDRLAAEGIRFTQAYNFGRCWPTRTALVTGYYPKQTGSDPNLGDGKHVKWTEPLPQVMRRLGYRTMHSGKWHVLADQCNSAHSAGFDRAYDFAQGYLYYTPKFHALDGKLLPRPTIEDDYFMDIAVTDYMLEFLREHDAEHGDQPFFAYLSFNCPHYPLKAPPRYIEKYRGRYDEGWDVIRARRFARQQELGFPDSWALSEPEPHVVSVHSPADAEARAAYDARYGFEEVYEYVPWDTLSPERQRKQAAKMEIHAAMVDLVDEQVGRVLDLLEEQGRLDNTLVLFLSDNGADVTFMLPNVQLSDDLVYDHDPSAPWGSEDTCLALGPAWGSTSNTPFRRHKIWMHEGGIATPLIARWPRGIDLPPGSLTRTPATVLDFLPTFISLAGGDPKPSHVEAPPFPGKSLAPAFAGRPIPRDEPFFFEHVGNRALIDGDWKLVSSIQDGGEWELFNLADDRSETQNLASKAPERVERMGRRWEDLNDEFRKEGGYTKRR